MEQPADFSLLEANGALRAQLTGDWTSRMLGDAAERLRRAMAERSPKIVDLNKIGRCDTSGAFAIARAADIVQSKRTLEARPETQRLMQLVSKASEAADVPPAPRVSGWTHFLERLGWRGQATDWRARLDAELDRVAALVAATGWPL